MLPQVVYNLILKKNNERKVIRNEREKVRRQVLFCLEKEVEKITTFILVTIRETLPPPFPIMTISSERKRKKMQKFISTKLKGKFLRFPCYVLWM